MKTLLVAVQPQRRQLLSEALKRRKHEVTVVESAHAACAGFQSGGYRLVVLETDGQHEENVLLCRQLRALLQGRPCLILAAGEPPQPERLNALLAAGADDYLTDLDDPQQLELRLTVAEYRADGGDRPGGESSARSLISCCPLLRDAPYGAFRADIKGEFTEVNQALVTMLGYDSKEELLAANISRDVYRDPARRRRLLTQLVALGHVEAVEVEWTRKDGTPITVLASGRAVRDHTGAVVQAEGIAHDITEQKAAQEALKATQARFQYLVASSPAMIYSCVPSGDYGTTFISENVTSQLGYEVREFTEDPRFWADRIHPEDAPRIFAELPEVFETGHHAYEYRFLHKDGSYRWMRDEFGLSRDASGRPLEIVGYCIDITDRRRAEQTLAEELQRSRLILKTSMDGFYTIDMQGRFLEANPSLCAIMGYTRDELLSMNIRDVEALESPEEIAQHIKQVVESGLQRFETKHRHKDGRLLDVEISVHHCKLHQDEFMFAFVRDITQRTRAERALCESEQRFRAIFDNAVDGILLADRETRGFVVGNPALCHLLGYSLEEIGTLGVKDIHREEDLPYVLERFDEQMEGRSPLSRDIPVKRRDGSVFYADISSFSMTLAGRPHAAAIFRDVTEHKRAADRLRESEERYRLIADNVSDLIWTATLEGLDTAAGRLENADPTRIADELLRHWKFTYFSPSVERLLGYSLQEAIALKFEDLLPPDSYARAKAALAGELAVEQQQPGQRRERVLEVQHRAKDGSIRWVEVTCTFWRDREKRPVGVLGVTRDISQRRHAEEALRKSESKFRTLFMNIPDIVVLVDRNGCIQYANHAGPETTMDTLIGSNGLQFIVPEHLEQCRARLQQAFDTGDIETIEVPSAGGRWWSARLVPIVEDGTVGSLMAICTDITERKRSAEAIQKEQRLLRQLLDLHERDRQLTAYEIHDGFSQYLTGALYNLQGFRELHAKEPSHAWKTFDVGLALIRRSIDETRRLIGGLRPPILDEAGIVAAVDYLACETQEREEAEVEFVHDVRFQRLAPPLESAIFRVVQESLTNARRHSQSPKIRIELAQQNDRVRISVRDWGIGFDPSKVEEGRFGLRGIRERARLFGGQVTIETAPDQGTHISVELPLVGAAAEPPGP